MLNAKRSVKKKLRVWPRGGEPIKPKTIAKLVQNKNDILSKKVPPRSQICVNRWIDGLIDIHLQKFIAGAAIYIYMYILTKNIS